MEEHYSSHGHGHDHTHDRGSDAFDPGDTPVSESSSGEVLSDASLEDSLSQAFSDEPVHSSHGHEHGHDHGSDVFDPGDTPVSTSDEHIHAKPEGAGSFSTHATSEDIANARTLFGPYIGFESELLANVGSRGDLLMPGGGDDTVIGSGDRDVIVGTGGGINTITTGSGGDTIILGAETTNRVFDFDPAQDRFVLSDDLDPNNIQIVQGSNPTNGGIDQPLDSDNNALVLDRRNGHILASLPFVDVGRLNENIFKVLRTGVLEAVEQANFDTIQEGGGQLTGTTGRDKLVGGDGPDFLYVGDDGFQIGTARATGAEEFPFPNDSPGTSEATATLSGGRLTITGSYQNFDGAPLFSQGEQVVDETAIILNGSDPEALINGFLQVPQDGEGNPITGTHLHFSPSGDSRGSFADATVERYLDNVVVDAKSGTIAGEFELSPEEQAAFLAGNYYVNLHTNVDLDGDGKGGFVTGENRLNFNQNVVQFV